MYFWMELSCSMLQLYNALSSLNLPPYTPVLSIIIAPYMPHCVVFLLLYGPVQWKQLFHSVIVRKTDACHIMLLSINICILYKIINMYVCMYYTCMVYYYMFTCANVSVHMYRMQVTCFVCLQFLHVRTYVRTYA